MKKKIVSILSLLLLFTCTGCIKRDSLEDIDIYTTIYPIEYITNRLYGEHSNVYSIYPDGINVKDYSLTDKQIEDYSKAKMMIFNGLSNEKDYVISMYQKNNHIKIIDTTLSMEYANSYEELWLDPLNFLMMAQNIRTGFRQYINNHYLKNEIDENYENLKIEISNLDAKIKLMVENASNKTIVVSSDLFKFLEKYNLTVLSLEEGENLTDLVKANVEDLIKNKEISYIFLKQGEEANDTIKELIEGTDIQIIYLHTLENLTEEERSKNKDYISIMNENIELLKQEVYD